jgi:hypothetical protein
MVPDSAPVLGHSPRNYRGPEWANTPTSGTSLRYLNNEESIDSIDTVNSKLSTMQFFHYSSES